MPNKHSRWCSASSPPRSQGILCQMWPRPWSRMMRRKALIESAKGKLVLVVPNARADPREKDEAKARAVAKRRKWIRRMKRRKMMIWRTFELCDMLCEIILWHLTGRRSRWWWWCWRPGWWGGRGLDVRSTFLQLGPWLRDIFSDKGNDLWFAIAADWVCHSTFVSSWGGSQQFLRYVCWSPKSLTCCHWQSV